MIVKIFISLFCILNLINCDFFYQKLAWAETRLTNPLLGYVKFRELKPFKDKVEDIIKREKDSGLINAISVYFRSLMDGMWFGIDEKEKFCPASLLKVPIMMAYLKIAESKPEILNRKFKYEFREDDISRNIKLNPSARLGQYYTVDKLINMMIGESDNIATGILLENIDKNTLEQIFTYLGVSSKGFSAKDDFVSLKAYASLFRVLYNGAFLNEEMSEKALRCLKDSIFKDGIVAGLPKDMVIAHKFGERFLTDEGIKQLHEIGIVYYPNNAYILGIMTRGKDFSSQSKVIREISSFIYNEVDRQVKTWRAEDYISEF